MIVLALEDLTIKEKQAPVEIFRYIKSFDSNILKKTKFYKITKDLYDNQNWLKSNSSFINELISKEVILFLNHDHSYTSEIWNSIDLKFKKLVILDAHNDYSATENERLYNYNFLNFIDDRFENGICLGLRHKHSDMPLHHKIHYCNYYEMANTSLISLQLENFTENENVYLSIDLDVLDPSCFKSVKNPIPGGISFKELMFYIEICIRKSSNIVIDISEFDISTKSNPDFVVYKKLIEDICEMVFKYKG